MAVAVDHVVLTDAEIELFTMDTLASLLVRYDPKSVIVTVPEETRRLMEAEIELLMRLTDWSFVLR